MTRASQQLRGDAADVGAIEIETNAADEVVEVLFFAQARVGADGTGLRALRSSFNTLTRGIAARTGRVRMSFQHPLERCHNSSTTSQEMIPLPLCNSRAGSPRISLLYGLSVPIDRGVLVP